MQSDTYNQQWRRDMLEFDYEMAITLGLVEGATVREVIGYNPDLAAADTVETIWPEGGIYAFPADVGEAMEIVSDNAADAQVFRVELLDADFLESTQFIPLTGTTPVVVPGGPYARVQSMTNVGATDTLGNVRVRQSGAGPVYAVATLADQRTAQAVVTVPAGKTGVIRRAQYAFNKAGNPDALAVVRFAAGIFGRATLRATRIGLSKRGSSAFPINIPVTEAVPERTDLSVEGASDAADSDITTLFTLVLFDNERLTP